MPEYKKHLSEAAVDEFIEAIKVIAEDSCGVIRINSRDEAMMRAYLVARPIGGKGICVDISPCRVDIKSSEFAATWSRRRYGD